MTKSLSRLHNPTRFFELLADADAIQVRESPSPLTNEGRVRSFVVHITSPVPAAPEVPNIADFEPSRIAESAELLLESSDFVLARNLFSHILNDNLKDARALRGLGICLFHLSEHTSARKCFKAWHEVHGADLALYWLGKSFAAEGDNESALAAFSRVTDTHAFTFDEKMDLYRSHGNCFAKTGDLRLAEERYRKALELQPQSDSLLVCLGSLEIQKGNPDFAERHFRLALQAQPRNSKAYCGLGLTAMAAQNSSLATAYFHKALELDAENWLALEQWGAAYKPGADFTRLETHLLRYIEIHPGSAQALALAADLYSRNELHSASDRYLQQALLADPKNVRALLVKARAESI
jgi:tetratricopeptide (TPR) repeat protein